MPKYFYTAKSFKGKAKSGIYEATNEKELARILRQKGYVLISASLEEEKEKQIQISFPFLERVSLIDKIMFARNLRIMISAGMSLPRALDTLSFQTKSKKFSKVLLKISDEVTKGKSFSEALSAHSDIFNELFVNMIKVGEESGTLENVLETLANQMEREHELKSKVKGAMIYPTVIILAMIGIGILMLIVVVPKLAQTFEELGVELPATTQFVISFGSFLAQKWALVLLLIILFVIAFRFFLKTIIGKKIFDFLILRLPIISPIIKKTNVAYTARTLSSLFTSGVPIVKSLEIMADTLGNFYFRGAMIKAVEKVKKGSKLSESLISYQDLYSPIFLQMLQVGEETGETSEILAKLADFFEEEVTNSTKNLSAVIEPLLMLLIGGTVGFFAVSMIQPIYSMLGAIK